MKWYLWVVIKGGEGCFTFSPSPAHIAGALESRWWWKTTKERRGQKNPRGIHLVKCDWHRAAGLFGKTFSGDRWMWPSSCVIFLCSNHVCRLFHLAFSDVSLIQSLPFISIKMLVNLFELPSLSVAFGWKGRVTPQPQRPLYEHFSVIFIVHLTQLIRCNVSGLFPVETSTSITA